MNVTVQIPVDQLEAIVREQVTAILTEQSAPTSPWLNTAEAADYLRCSRQRIFDLTSAGALTVHKDGSRSLYRRDELDAYLNGGA